MSQKIKEIIVLTASYYQTTIRTEVLSMYVEDLCDLPEQSVIEAYHVFRRDKRNRSNPLPAQIRDLIEPSIDDDTMAREAASRIISAVSKFGWPNPDRAAEYIGELGWHVVKRFGGWQSVCEELGVSLDVTTFQAQARDIAKANVSLHKLGRFDEPINFIESKKQQGLTSAKDSMGFLKGRES